VAQPGTLRLVRASAVGTGLLLAAASFLVRTPTLAAQTDLDAFMRQVLARRDDNWKKLQQYILDEREQIELRGPSHQPLWGEQRDYTWYLRDGFFVRSPVKFNGVTIGEAERRKYETEFLRREQERDKRQQRAQSGGADRTQPAAAGDQPSSVDALILQTRQPKFISSAYFLRFKFEEGKYALVGREHLDGHELLRIEYYPAKLFSDEQRRRQARSHDQKDPWDAEMQRMLNKVALVTLWVEPTAHQVVKYTFNNVGFDFLPAQWLVRLNDVRASMTMGQPFPDVWLPHDLEMRAAITLAVGEFDVRYALDYHDYRQADVKTKVRIGGDR